MVHGCLVEIELGHRSDLLSGIEQIHAVVVHRDDRHVVFVVFVPGDSHQLLVGFPQNIGFGEISRITNFYLISKCLTLQSAPTVAKNWGSGEKLTSKTSLSWAISVLMSCSLLMSQIEQVVSMLHVMMVSILLELQSKDVKGAVSSFFC